MEGAAKLWKQSKRSGTIPSGLLAPFCGLFQVAVGVIVPSDWSMCFRRVRCNPWPSKGIRLSPCVALDLSEACFHTPKPGPIAICLWQQEFRMLPFHPLITVLEPTSPHGAGLSWYPFVSVLSVWLILSPVAVVRFIPDLMSSRTDDPCHVAAVSAQQRLNLGCSFVSGDWFGEQIALHGAGQTSPIFSLDLLTEL